MVGSNIHGYVDVDLVSDVKSYGFGMVEDQCSAVTDVANATRQPINRGMTAIAFASKSPPWMR
jgi:hypothetical protein